ncbi:hypothetical protein N9N67_09475, partial [Bacteriovoracaceae bacterium]|nr:hypothetical protein [Bacteriovoracaceae bacterium]
LVQPEIWNLLNKDKSSSLSNMKSGLLVNNTKDGKSSNISTKPEANQQSGVAPSSSDQGKEGFYNPRPAETNSETVITARSIGLKNSKKLKNFDINFMDDLDEYKSSNLSGKVILNTSIVNSHGNRRLKLSAKGTWPTQVDVSIDEGSFVYDDVVLLEQDFVDSLKLYEQHQDHRAIALFRLNEDIEDIEIEGGEKVYLNKKLKKVNPSAASYVLFKGLTPGNTIVNFILAIGDRETSKIVYIPEGELYYDDPLIRVVDKSNFNIQEMYLTANKGRPLSFAPKIFENFFYDSKMKKIGINKYREGRTYLPLGTRNYYAINFKKEKIYFGTGSKSSISLPGLEFSDFVMDELQLSDPMKDECLVQLNFSKQVEKVSFETYGEYGSTMGDLKYRTARGDFVSEVEDEIVNAYLISKEQGVFFVKVKYIDQSYDYLQTFCSIGSYLVEQL